MKKFLTLTLIIGVTGHSLAQDSRKIPAPPPLQGGSTGSLTTRRATLDAEQKRAIQEARMMKATKEEMTANSFQGRQPVISNASQFLEYNRPAVSTRPSEVNAPYKVPETYGSEEGPPSRSGNSPTRDQRSSATNEGEPNRYTYPGRVSEGGQDSSEPVFSPEGVDDTTKRKSRPSFFKWLKNRNSTPQENSGATKYTSPQERSFQVPPISTTANTPVAEGNEIPPSSAANQREAPAPPSEFSGSTVSPPSSGNPAPDFTLPAENTMRKKRGLFKKIFRRKG